MSGLLVLVGCSQTHARTDAGRRAGRDAAVGAGGMRRDAAATAGDAFATDREDAQSGRADGGSSGSTQDASLEAGPAVGGDGGVEPPDGAATACVVQSGVPVQVDAFLMLDRSGSMREATGTGPTKWDAIRAALTTFVRDPASNGLGVGLQYFPLGKPGVPASCFADADCGAEGGQCAGAKACRPPPPPASPSFIPCLNDADCPSTSSGCVSLGICSGDSTLACFDLGTGGCPGAGDCVQRKGECSGWATCVDSDYASAAVPIAALPTHADALVESWTAEQPIGLTPTPAALSGALELLAKHAAQYPDHRVIAVLATDGLPTTCLPAAAQTVEDAVTAVVEVATRGLAKQPSIPTYVIGVIAPNDPNAGDQLQRIAVAGGTSAFMIDPSLDLGPQLLDALAKLRSENLGCEYQLPAGASSQSLDFDRVNLLVPGTQNRALFNVRSQTDCGTSDLAWFYDADPGSGQQPTRIALCPGSCAALRASSSASVDIQLGCTTRHGP